MKRSLAYVPIAVFTLALLIAPEVHAQDADAAVLTVTTTSPEAEAHFWQGMHDVANIFFSRAAMHFEQALAADPELAMAQMMHAVFAPGLQDPDRIDRAEAALPGLAEASTEELLVGLAMLEGLRDDDAAQQSLIAAAAELLPDDPYVAWMHAGTVGANGSAERADAWRAVTERFPDMAAPYNILAYTLWNLGDEADAREAVKTYVELAPDHPNPHDSYAELLQFSGLYSEALTHYQQAVSLDADYFVGYDGQAEVYVLMGRGDAAREVLEQAEPHAPTEAARANLQRAIANTYFMEGEAEDGMRSLRAAAEALQAADASAQAAQAHRELAVAEALFGKPDEIAAHLQQAAALDEPDGGHHFWATVAHGLAGHAEEARRAADAFAETAGDGPWTATLDAAAHLAAGDLEQAERALLASDLDAPLQQALMAKCQKDRGREAEAQAFSEALMADNAFNIYNLGFAFARHIPQSRPIAGR